MKHEELTEREGLEYLAALASLVPDELAVVELGTHQGGSLVYLATHPNAYGIDAWGLKGAYRSPRMARYYNAGNMAIAQAVLEEAGLAATLIREFSTEAARTWDGPKVGLLYIDAVHTFDAVIADYIAWKPHLVSGAWVCFDDHNDRYPGVKAAVSSLCSSDLEWVELVGTRLAVTRI